MKKIYSEMAQMFKALCDENRIKIMEMLAGGEMCAAEILEELNVTQPTLSHHMKTLCDVGLVEQRKSGKWTYYRISSEGCNVLEVWLGSLVSEGKKNAEVSLARIAAQRTEKLLKSKAVPKKKTVVKKSVTSKPKTVEKKKEEPSVEAPRRRDVDIVIL